MKYNSLDDDYDCTHARDKDEIEKIDAGVQFSYRQWTPAGGMCLVPARFPP